MLIIKLTYSTRKPGTKWVPLQVAAAVSHSYFQVLKWLMAATSPGRHPHHFDGVGPEKVHLPPRWGFLLGFGAAFAIVVGTFLAIVGVQGTTASHRCGLIGWLSVSYVSAWNKTTDLLTRLLKTWAFKVSYWWTVWWNHRSLMDNLKVSAIVICSQCRDTLCQTKRSVKTGRISIAPGGERVVLTAKGQLPRPLSRGRTRYLRVAERFVPLVAFVRGYRARTQTGWTESDPRVHRNRRMSALGFCNKISKQY